jgi:hypothetical protein
MTESKERQQKERPLAVRLEGQSALIGALFSLSLLLSWAPGSVNIVHKLAKEDFVTPFGLHLVMSIVSSLQGVWTLLIFLCANLRAVLQGVSEIRCPTSAIWSLPEEPVKHFIGGTYMISYESATGRKDSALAWPSRPKKLRRSGSWDFVDVGVSFRPRERR